MGTAAGEGDRRQFHTPDSTSSSLIVRAKSFEPQAWQRLVDLYGPLIYRWCRVAGLQAADAADVAQEVFQTVAVRIVGFHHDRTGDTFRGWLRAVTRNKIGDCFRRHRAEPSAKGGSEAQVRLQQISKRSPRPRRAMGRRPRGNCSRTAPWNWSAASLRTAPGRRFGGLPPRISRPPPLPRS